MKLKFKRHIYKKKTIFSWLIAYLLILIIPILFVGISYTYIGSVIEKKITELNYSMLRNAGVRVDDILDNIVNISNELMNNDNITKMAKYKMPLTTEEMIEVSEAESIWSNYASVNQYINDMYIYFPENKQIFSYKRMYSIDDFFKSSHLGKSVDLKDEWIENVLQKQKAGYIFAEKDASVFYVQPNMVNRVEDVPYSIIIKLNMDALMQYGRRNLDNNFFLCSSDGKLIAGENRENEKLLMLNTANYGNSSGTYKVNGKKYIFVKLRSQNVNWYYTDVTLKSEYFRELNIIYLIMFITILFSLICGGVAIYKSIKHNNKPLKELFNFFAKNSDKKFNDIDVYSYINTELIKIINEKNQYEDQLISQREVLKKDILSNLVAGKTNESYPYEKQMRMADVKYEGDLYVSIIFYVDDIDKMFFERISDRNEAAKTAKYIVSNIAKELIGNVFNIEIFENHGLLTGIVNIDDNNEFSAIRILTDIAMELTDFIKQEFNFTVAVSISDMHYSLSGIRDAYSEAVIGIEHLMSSDNNVISYNSIKISDKELYLYTNETEQQILNLLEECEYKKCSLLIDTVLDNYMRAKGSSLWITKYFAFDFLNTFLKMAMQMNNKELIDLVKNNGEKISNCVTNNETLGIVKDTAKKFIEILENTEMDNSVTSVYTKIKIYVDNNYDNPDLNVNKVADEFSMNASVLSNQFKNAWNIGLSDYINNKRIEKAKKLLATTNKKVNEIAVLSGFSSDRTFQRMFQKAENLSASKWRELYKNV